MARTALWTTGLLSLAAALPAADPPGGRDAQQVKPRLVTLKSENNSLDQVLDDVQKQTDVAVDRSRADTARPVKVSCERLTFWEALERVAKAADHRVAFAEQGRKVLLLGGEGASWMGEAPFVKTKHVFQNIGDGTYFHSGFLAVRATIASGVNVTFKILYNDAVAMTGGQHIDGNLTPPQIARELLAEGVKKVVVVTDEPQKYATGAFPPEVAAKLGELGGHLELVAWDETDDPIDLVRSLAGGVMRVGVQDQMWARFALRLRAVLDPAQVVEAGPTMSALRSVKEPEEIERLRRAASAADAAMTGILGERLSGRTEAEVSTRIRELLIEAGHETAEFGIVASGPNAASPHHAPGDRVIGDGDAIVLDIGGTLAGYASDTSRTAFVGDPPADFAALYEVLREAQRAASVSQQFLLLYTFAAIYYWVICQLITLGQHRLERRLERFAT